MIKHLVFKGDSNPPLDFYQFPQLENKCQKLLKEDESVDLASLTKMIQFIEKSNVDGITVSGLLGESNRLIDSEKESLISTAVEATDGRLPVIATLDELDKIALIEILKEPKNSLLKQYSKLN